MSPDFLKRLAELRQARLRTQDFQKWMSNNPKAATKTGVWNAAPWTGQTAQAIVYDPLTGKAFPNPAAALSAGVKNFSYQIPSGMNVDWSYWDQFAQPAVPAPAMANTSTMAVNNQTQPFNASASSPPPTSSPTSAPEPFQMGDEAKRFAAAGMFGRAKKSVEAAGGNWSGDMHRQLKADAEGKKNYGGDFKNQGTIDSVVDKYGYTNAAQNGKITKKVQMGKAKRDYEAKHGQGSFTKDVHVAIAAAAQRAYNQNKAKKN